MTPALKQKLANLEFMQRLRKLMKEKNLNIWDIAKIAGCAPGSVSRWLNLHSAPHQNMQTVLLKDLEKIDSFFT